VTVGGVGGGFSRREGEFPGVLMRGGGNGAGLLSEACILMLCVGAIWELAGQFQLFGRHLGFVFLDHERALAFAGFVYFLIPMTNPRSRFVSSCRDAAT
jgi:hypothetical protein